MRVTPVRPVPVDIAARDARIAQARKLTRADVDASALVGLEVGGLDAHGISHVGIAASVATSNAASTYVLTTLVDGTVIRFPKSLIPNVLDQLAD